MGVSQVKLISVTICRPRSTAASNEPTEGKKDPITPDTAAVISDPARQVVLCVINLSSCEIDRLDTPLTSDKIFFTCYHTQLVSPHMTFFSLFFAVIQNSWYQKLQTADPKTPLHSETFSTSKNFLSLLGDVF